MYFEVAGKGYAVHAWASAAGVTQRMRTLMRKINRRAGAELIPNARIEKMSSKTLRVTMATRLYRAGVPMPEIVEMGEWEDEEMARKYIRTLQPMSGARRNVSDVMARKQVARQQTVAVEALVASGADAEADDAEADDVVAVTDATASGSGTPAVMLGLDVQLVTLTEKRKTAVKRGREAELQVCCPEEYVAQGGCLLRTSNLEEDAVLRGLWAANEQLPQGKLAKLMCDNKYHCSRSEVHNLRARLKERERIAKLQ